MEYTLSATSCSNVTFSPSQTHTAATSAANTRVHFVYDEQHKPANEQVACGFERLQRRKLLCVSLLLMLLLLLFLLLFVVFVGVLSPSLSVCLDSVELRGIRVTSS